MLVEDPTLYEARKVLNQSEIDELIHLMGFKIMSGKQWIRINQLWDLVSERIKNG